MKKTLIFLLSFLLFCNPVLADSSFVAPSAIGQAATGQIPGTTTNDNASTGNIGEYRSASNADTNLAQSSATVTITIASPAVITWTAGSGSPFVFNGTGTAAVNFTTSGALPTGIVTGTNYYAFNAVGNTFNIATSVDNAIAGTAINTSGSQSGTQTGVPTIILTTGTPVSFAAISLTAGDWDITADFSFFAGGTTSISILGGGTSTLSTANNNIPGRLTQLTVAANVPGVSNNVMHTGPARYSLSATTTIYCTASATFTLSTLATWGGCRARRVR